MARGAWYFRAMGGVKSAMFVSGETDEPQTEETNKTGASGRDSPRRLPEAAGLERQQAGAGAARGDADRGDCARSQARDCGYGVAVSAVLHTNAEFWLNLQNFYELEISRRSEAGAKIDVQVQPWERDRRAASGAAEIEETADSSLRSE
jgi:hypothetical protein